MTSIKISNLPPTPAGTGTGTSQGTDLFPATDTTDTTSSSSGTTKKYTLAEIYGWMLQAQGLTVYDAVLVATTGALTATYDNGTSGVGATLTNSTTQSALSIDGVTLAVDDRVLVWQQTDSTENGIYAVTNAGSSSTNWIMTRATDYDEPDDIVQYGVMLVNQGDTYASKLFQETDEGPFTIGSTSINFALYTAATLQVPVLLSQGGTSASLTADNGGIFYSTASSGAILASTSTSGKVLQSGSSSAPSWSTPTYPSSSGSNGTIIRSDGTNNLYSSSTFADTYSASSLLYSNGADTVTGLATSNSAMLFTNSSGVPAWTSSATNGQLLIGSTGASPVLGELTAGTGISISNGAGNITINATGSGLTWSTIAGTTQSAAVNNGYVVGNASQTTITLPATFSIGDTIIIKGFGAGGWILQANAGDTIQNGQVATSAGGTLTSYDNYDVVQISGLVANTTWSVDYAFSVGLNSA